jgi:hypothetical protein
MRRIVAATLILLTQISLLTGGVIVASANDVRYLGSYWGQGGVRDEVAPGDSGARLTIALGNEYEEDSISNVVGKLWLPPQFRSQNRDNPRVVESHFLGIVPPGGAFELTFVLDVEPSAAVGLDYQATLELSYRIVGESRGSQFIPVKINIPGRPLIKLSLNATSVKPGLINNVELRVSNEGSGPASDLRVSFTPQPGGVTAIILPEHPWIVGTLRPGEEAHTVLQIHAPREAGGSVSVLSASLTYRNAIGVRVEYPAALSLYIERPEIESIDVRVWAQEIRVEPGGTAEAVLYIENIGTAPAYDVVVEAGQSPAPAGLSGATSWSIGNLLPGERRSITTNVAAAQAAANGVYQLPLIISYKDAAGNRKSSTSILTVLVGDIPPKAPNLLIFSQPSIRAGSPQKVSVSVENIHSGEIRRLSITATPRTPGITILGSNNWLFESLKPGQKAELVMEVYADPAVSGSSATIYLTSTYVLADKEERASEDREIGFIVEGYVTLTIYDLKVVTIGGDYFLIGNILNEGISDALFSSIKLEGAEMGENSLFLGEIKPNAPVPFNLRVNPNSPVFTGTLLIKYKDVFRVEHLERFNLELTIPVRESGQEGAQSQPLQASSVVFVLLAAVVAGVAALFWRSRRHASHRHS